MGGVWEHYGALWVVCGSIMEHYGWCVGALWVVCGSIRERNYRLKKKNYLSGPSKGPPQKNWPFDYRAFSALIYAR